MRTQRIKERNDRRIGRYRIAYWVNELHRHVLDFCLYLAVLLYFLLDLHRDPGIRPSTAFVFHNRNIVDHSRILDAGVVTKNQVDLLHRVGQIDDRSLGVAVNIE